MDNSLSKLEIDIYNATMDFAEMISREKRVIYDINIKRKVNPKNDRKFATSINISPEPRDASVLINDLKNNLINPYPGQARVSLTDDEKGFSIKAVNGGEKLVGRYIEYLKVNVEGFPKME